MEKERKKLGLPALYYLVCEGGHCLIFKQAKVIKHLALLVSTHTHLWELVLEYTAISLYYKVAIINSHIHGTWLHCFMRTRLPHTTVTYISVYLAAKKPSINMLVHLLLLPNTIVPCVAACLAARRPSASISETHSLTFIHLKYPEIIFPVLP